MYVQRPQCINLPRLNMAEDGCDASVFFFFFFCSITVHRFIGFSVAKLDFGTKVRHVKLVKVIYPISRTS